MAEKYGEIKAEDAAPLITSNASLLVDVRYARSCFRNNYAFKFC